MAEAPPPSPPPPAGQPPQGPYAPPPAGQPPQGPYAPSGQPPYPPQYAPPPPAKSGKGCLIAGIIVGVVLLLAVAVVVALMFFVGKKVGDVASTAMDNAEAASNLISAEITEDQYYSRYDRYLDDPAELRSFASTVGGTATPRPTYSGYTSTSVKFVSGTSPGSGEVAVKVCSLSGSDDGVLLQTQTRSGKTLATFLVNGRKSYYATGSQQCPNSDSPGTPWSSSQGAWNLLPIGSPTSGP